MVPANRMNGDSGMDGGKGILSVLFMTCNTYNLIELMFVLASWYRDIQLDICICSGSVDM